MRINCTHAGVSTDVQAVLDADGIGRLVAGS